MTAPQSNISLPPTNLLYADSMKGSGRVPWKYGLQHNVPNIGKGLAWARKWGVQNLRFPEQIVRDYFDILVSRRFLNEPRLENLLPQETAGGLASFTPQVLISYHGPFDGTILTEY